MSARRFADVGPVRLWPWGWLSWLGARDGLLARGLTLSAAWTEAVRLYVTWGLEIGHRRSLLTGQDSDSEYWWTVAMCPGSEFSGVVVRHETGLHVIRLYRG